MSVFLSYGRGDDEPFVERLYHRLVADGFAVWWDRQSMPSRSLTFLEEIRAAIGGAERVLVVIGPDAVRSDYVRAEWQSALGLGKPVTPLLRLGTYDVLPAELAGLHAPDVRAGRDFGEAAAEVVRVLRDPLPPLGELLGQVPPPPPHFQPRPDALSRIAASVLLESRDPAELASGRSVTVVHGIGGAGKTVLASTLARAVSTRRSFTDGVVWLHAGEEAEPVRLVQEAGRVLGDAPEAYASLEPGVTRLRRLLNGRRMLLVLDNCWRVGQVEPLLSALPAGCSLLVTTRGPELAGALGARAVEVGLLSPDEARQQLADWAGCEPEELPAEALAVAEQAGNLSLAIALNGAMARAGNSWSDLLDALAASELDFADARLAGYPHATVYRSLAVSIDFLEREDAQAARCYRELAVLRFEEAVPEAAVAVLWRHHGGLPERASRALLTRLEGRGMLRLVGTAPDRHVILHDLQLDLLRSLMTDRVAAHRGMVDAYRQLCGGNWTDGPRDGYFHEAIVHHLLAAGLADEVEQLLRRREQGGANAWSTAHARNGTPARFALDVRRAWEHLRGQAQAGSPPASTLPAQIRYALMIASVNALARALPAGLLPVAMVRGGWTVPEALARIRQVAEPEQRVAAYVAIIGNLPDGERGRVLTEALRSIRAIPDGYWRAGALVGVLRHLPGPLLGEARAIAEGIPDQDRPAALAAIAAVTASGAAAGPVSAPDPLAGPDAELLLHYVNQPSQAVRLLVPTVEDGQAAGAEALEQVRTIADPRSRALALAAVAAGLPEPRRAAVEQEALEAARLIGDEEAQAAARFWVALRVAQDGHPERAVELVGSSPGPGRRALGLARLLPALGGGPLPVAVAAASREAEAIPDPRERALARAAVVVGMVEAGAAADALPVARSIEEPDLRVGSLAALLEAVPADGRATFAVQLSTELASLVDQHRWAAAVNRSARQLPVDELARAVARAEDLGDGGLRDQVLAALVPELFAAGRSALAEQGLARIGQATRRADALYRASARLAAAGEVAAGLAVALRIEPPSLRAAAAAQLSGPGAGAEVETALDAMIDAVDPSAAPRLAVGVLGELAGRVGGERRERLAALLRTAAAAAPESERAPAVAGPAVALAAAGQLGEAMALLPAIDDEPIRSRTIARLAPLARHHDELSELAEHARGLTPPQPRIPALCAVLAAMAAGPHPGLREVLEEVLDLTALGYREGALAQMRVIVEVAATLEGASTGLAVAEVLEEVLGSWP